MKKNIILSAFNVHTGGGLVLIKDLLKSKFIKTKLLDLRIKSKISFYLPDVLFVKRKIIDRVYKFHKLCFFSKKQDVILCFNGLPPLFKPKSKIILFIQTFYFFSDINFFNTSNSAYNFTFLVYLRIKFEKLWFRFGIKNSDEIWVQTDTMKKRLIEYLNYIKTKKKFIIKIMPYVDNQIKYYLEKKSCKILLNPKKLFIYPSDDSGHKNHIRLFLALNKIDRDFKLYLTLNNEKFMNLLSVTKLNDYTKAKIINLGPITRNKLFNLYKNKIGTLIFPSMDESFGLPLVEAALFNKNILVSNKNYCNDILINAVKFNPHSITSIKTTIEKFLDSKKEQKTKIKKINFINYKTFVLGAIN